MTNPSIQDSQASIAGEPAHDQNNKNYPPIGHRSTESIFEDGDSIPILWKQVWHTTHGLAVEIIPKLAPMET